MRTFLIIVAIAVVVFVNALIILGAIRNYRKHSKKGMDSKKYFKRNNGSEAIIEIVGKHESGDYLCLWLFNSGKPFRYHTYEFDKEFVELTKKEVTDILLTERHLCGGSKGRMTDDKPDYWKVLPNGDKICSFCGSLHPDSVIAIIKGFGVSVLENSTKEYKWYINRPTVSNALEGGIKYYRHHDTIGFIAELSEILKNSKDEKTKAEN